MCPVTLTLPGLLNLPQGHAFERNDEPALPCKLCHLAIGGHSSLKLVYRRDSDSSVSISVAHVSLRRAYRKGEGERMPPGYHAAIIQQQLVVYCWVDVRGRTHPWSGKPPKRSLVSCCAGHA